MTIRGTFLASSEPWFGTVADLAAYVSFDRETWTAASNTPVQSSGNVAVELTDSERARNTAVKFTSSDSNLSDLIVFFAPLNELSAHGVNENTQRCQKTGIRFPVSQIVEDGLGRQVGSQFRIDAPKEEVL